MGFDDDIMREGIDYRYPRYRWERWGFLRLSAAIIAVVFIVMQLI